MIYFMILQDEKKSPARDRAFHVNGILTKVKWLQKGHRLKRANVSFSDLRPRNICVLTVLTEISRITAISS